MCSCKSGPNPSCALRCLCCAVCPVQTRCTASARRSMTGAGRSSWSSTKCWMGSQCQTHWSSRHRSRSSCECHAAAGAALPSGTSAAAGGGHAAVPVCFPGRPCAAVSDMPQCRTVRSCQQCYIANKPGCQQAAAVRGFAVCAAASSLQPAVAALCVVPIAIHTWQQHCSRIRQQPLAMAGVKLAVAGHVGSTWQQSMQQKVVRDRYSLIVCLLHAAGTGPAGPSAAWMRSTGGSWCGCTSPMWSRSAGAPACA